MSDGWDDYAQDWDVNPDVIQYSQLAFDSLSTHLNPSDFLAVEPVFLPKK